MGCRIQRKGNKSEGTIGVFVQHPFYGVCGITCAHVLLNKDEMNSCHENTNNKMWLSNDPKGTVYQPYPPHVIGVLRMAIVKEGNDNPIGIEIAVIQLTKRKPNSGQFSASRETREDGLEFNSGKICREPGENRLCFKYGSVTDYTEGTIIPSKYNAMIESWDEHNDSTKTKNEKQKTKTTIIRGQIMVKSSCKRSFAEEGDSGGPVFVFDTKGDIACIGIVEAGCKSMGMALVTPIGRIVDEIGVEQLIPFHPTNTKILREIEKIQQNQSEIIGNQVQMLGKLERLLDTGDHRSPRERRK
ncbi:hypothetical protein DPMN_031522 [Dreissena polymorpha]|uniref:Peptidase S1 domain-containing protein n=1 Tax=Dreissena polymorpha TaxID=45954 RepID=A0A9D4M3A0_DREPO|nr:hypothetical protein DPMN_031522 [Dreissena polymorpha]